MCHTSREKMHAISVTRETVMFTVRERMCAILVTRETSTFSVRSEHM